jgi:hypothetical protein
MPDDAMSEIGGSPNTAGATMARKSPVDQASGGATSAYESPEQEAEIKRRAAGGMVIDNNALGYMGHFAKDSVTSQGHNAGHKKVGPPAPVSQTKGAKQGYHVLPGSASGVQGRARFGPATNEELGLTTKKQRAEQDRLKKAQERLLGHGPMHDSAPHAVDTAPRAVSDVKLSVQHHTESIKNDLKHIADHKASIAKHKAGIKTRKGQLRSK